MKTQFFCYFVILSSSDLLRWNILVYMQLLFVHIDVKDLGVNSLCLNAFPPLYYRPTGVGWHTIHLLCIFFLVLCKWCHLYWYLRQSVFVVTFLSVRDLLQGSRSVIKHSYRCVPAVLASPGIHGTGDVQFQWALLL